MIALDAVTPLSQLPTKPMKMRNGGDPVKKLAEGPPENINQPVMLQDGGPPQDGGPSNNTSSLMPRFDQFTPEQKEQLNEEIYRKHFFDMLNEQILRDEREQDPYFRMEEERRRNQFFNIPELVPAGGIMGISQSTNTGLQNNGIMDIVEKLKITKPLYDI
jgi:hypothetical protein